MAGPHATPLPAHASAAAGAGQLPDDCLPGVPAAPEAAAVAWRVSPPRTEVTEQRQTDELSADPSARTVSSAGQPAASAISEEAPKTKFGGQEAVFLPAPQVDADRECLDRSVAICVTIEAYDIENYSDAGIATTTPLKLQATSVSMRRFKSTASGRKHVTISTEGGHVVHRTTTGGAFVAASMAPSASLTSRTAKRARVTSWPSAYSAQLPVRGELSVTVKEAASRFEEEYRIEKEIGQGSFGHVFRAVRVADGLCVAVKTVVDEGVDDYLQHELDITKRLSHPHVCWLHDIFRSDRVVHLVMELCTGGDLFDKLASGQWLTDRMLAVYTWQMISGIAYCHYHEFCHRDIKPENYLLKTQRGDAALSLIDFGLACKFAPGTAMTSSVGSIYYISPEVIAGSYSEKRDIWSIGIVAYMMCTKNVPYMGGTDDEIVQEISNGTLHWVLLDSRLSPSHPLRKLIQRCLTVGESQRPSAGEVAKDEWLRDQGTRPLSRRCCLPFL